MRKAIEPKPCRLSERGIQQAGEKMGAARTTGTAVGESNDKTCWRVKWEGRVTVENWNKDLIEIIEA